MDDDSGGDTPPMYAEVVEGPYPSFVLSSSGFDDLLKNLREDANPQGSISQLEKAVDVVMLHLKTDRCPSGNYDDDLLSDMLPTAVEELMRRVNFAEEVKETVNNFFQRMLELIVLHLQVTNTNYRLLKTLALLFSHSNRLFFMLGPGSSKPGQSRANDTGYSDDLPVRPAIVGPISPLFVKNVNHFAGLSAFDVLIQKVESLSVGILKSNSLSSVNSKEEPDGTKGTRGRQSAQTNQLQPPPAPGQSNEQNSDIVGDLLVFDTVKLLASPFFLLVDILVPRYMKKFGLRLRNAVVTQLLKLPDAEFKAHHQKEIPALVQSLVEYLEKAGLYQDSRNLPTLMQLETGVRCLSQLRLETRLQGLKQIMTVMGQYLPLGGDAKGNLGPLIVITSASQQNDDIEKGKQGLSNKYQKYRDRVTNLLHNVEKGFSSDSQQQAPNTPSKDSNDSQGSSQLSDDAKAAKLGPLYLGTQPYEGNEVLDKAMAKALFWWMEEKDLFAKLFEHMHAEVVRKAVPIMVIYARAGRVQQRHLEMLWKAGDGQHHSVRVITYSAILALVRHLGRHQIDWLLLEHLIKMKPSACDQEDVMFLKQFAGLAREAFPDHIAPLADAPTSTRPISLNIKSRSFQGMSALEKEAASPKNILVDEMYGMGLLWDFIACMEESNLGGYDISNLAQRCVVELVQTPAFEPFRPELLRRGLAALEKHTAVPEYLDAMTKILETYPGYGKTANKKGQTASRSKIVMDLDRQYNLLNTLLADMEHYKTTAKATVHEMKSQRDKPKFVAGDNDSFTDLTDDVINSTILTADGVGRPHLQQITARLQFLEVLLTQTPLRLHQDQMDQLWQLCVNEALTAQETWAVFSWCEHLLVGRGADQQSPSFMAFEDLVTEHLFVNKMREVQFDEINPASYRLFERFFYHVNAKKNKLAIQLQGAAPGVGAFYEDPTFSKNTSQYTVVSFTFNDLLGLDSLWEIIVEAKSEEVGTMAIRTILRQLQSLTNMKRRAVKSVREEFVIKCMEIIEQACAPHTEDVPDTSVEARTLRINRILMLLEAFVESIGEPRVNKTSAGQFGALPTELDQNTKSRSKSMDFVFRSRNSVRKWRRRALSSDRPIGIHIEADGHKPIDITLRPYDTVKTLRDQCQNHLGLTSAGPSPTTQPTTTEDRKDMQFTLVSQGMELSDPAQSLAALNFTDGQRVYVIIKKETMQSVSSFQNSRSSASIVSLASQSTITTGSSVSINVQAAAPVPMENPDTMDDGDSDFPSNMLSNPKYFAMLYRLLSWSSATTAYRTLRLLRLLPLNADMLVSMCSINPAIPNWESMFPSVSEFQLMYSLQLVNHLFEISPPDTVELKTAAEKQTLVKPTKSGLTRHKSDTNVPALRRESLDVAMESLKNINEVKKGWIKRQQSTGGSEIYRAQSLSHIQQRAGDFGRIFVQKGGVEYLVFLFEDMAIRLSSLAEGSLGTPVNREAHLRGEVLISCVRLLIDLLCHTCLETRRTHDQQMDMSASARALHTVIPLVFNILKLPPSFLEADATTVNPPFLRQGMLDNLTSRSADAVPSLVTSVITATSIIINRGTWLEENEDETETGIATNLNMRNTVRLLFCVLEQCPTAITDEVLYNWIHLLLLENQRVLFREQAVSVFESFYRKRMSGSPYTVRPAFVNIGTRMEDCILRLLGLTPQYAKTCAQYFVTVVQLVSVADVDNDRGARDRYWNAALDVVKLIKSHSKQPMASAPLIQLLNLLTTLLEKLPDLRTVVGQPNRGGMVGCLVNEFLLLTDESLEQGIKTQSEDVRAAAFRCLAELVQDNTANLSELVHMLNAQFLHIKPPEGWDNTPHDLRKVGGSYVGLKNMGATCYVNSLTQQLFMIPELRMQLLSIDLASPSVTTDKLKTITEMFVNLQSVLSHLKDSERRYHDPVDFLSAFRDHDNQPIDVSQQMDVSEFFNVLMDRLETQLKAVNQGKMLDRVFGGTFASQVLSDECTHVSETKEPFFFVSLEVKNNDNIMSSLDQLIQADLLDGDNKYYCEHCQRYIRARRRVVLGDLPNTLVIHLKRFDFDFATLQQSKLNSRCEFPVDLNMMPYTKAYLKTREAASSSRTPMISSPAISRSPMALSPGTGRKDYGGAKDAAAYAARLESSAEMIDPSSTLLVPEYYEYSLKGIIVHQGTSDSGHYYSLIKERQAPDGSGECMWFRFNDTEVTPFDPKLIPDECFGGSNPPPQPPPPPPPKIGSPALQPAAPPADQGPVRLKAYNAYLLIYERKYPEMAQIHTHIQEIRWQKKEEEEKAAAAKKAEALLQPPSTPTEPNANGPSFFDPTGQIPTVVLPSTPQTQTPTPTPTPTPTTPAQAPSTTESSTQTQSPTTNARMEIENNAMTGWEEVQPKPLVPLSEVRAQIRQDNIMLLRKAQLYDHSFCSFFFDVLWAILWGLGANRPCDTAVLERFCELVTRFVVCVLSRAKDRHDENILDWFKNLKKLYTFCPKTAQWALGFIDVATSKDFLIKCPDGPLSCAFADLLAHILSLVQQLKAAPAPWLPLIDGLMDLKGDMVHFGTQTQAFYQFVKDFVQIGNQQREYVLQRGMIPLLVQAIKQQAPQNGYPPQDQAQAAAQPGRPGTAFSGPGQPSPSTGQTQTVQGLESNKPVMARQLSVEPTRSPAMVSPGPPQNLTRPGSPNPAAQPPSLAQQIHILSGLAKGRQLAYVQCVELLSLLVRSCDLGRETPCPTAIVPQFVQQGVSNLVMDEVLVCNLLFSGMGMRPAQDILSHLCWDSVAASKEVIHCFHDCVNALKRDDVITTAIPVYDALIGLSDSHQSWRLPYGLSIYLRLIELNPKGPLGEKFAKHLFARAAQVPAVRAWVRQAANKKAIEDVLKANGWEKYQLEFENSHKNMQ